MSKKKLSLGISQAVQEVKDNFENKVDLSTMKIVNLNINTLVEYEDNMKVFGNIEGREFEELCQSIKDRGVLQPIVVRPLGDQYEILAGHQRTRAVKALGQLKIQAIVKEVDDIEARMIWLETNIRGRHLSPKQLGEALDEAYKLIKLQAENGDIQIKGKVSHVLAEKFEMSPRSVEEVLMLTRKVAESVHELGLNKSSMSKMTKLEKEEQEALIALIGEDTIKSLTANEIETTVAKMKEEMENLDNSYKEDLSKTKSELENKEKELYRINQTFNEMRADLGKLEVKKVDMELLIEEEKMKREQLQALLDESTVEDKEDLLKEIEEKDIEIENRIKEFLKSMEEIDNLKEEIEDINSEKELIKLDFDNLQDDYKALYDENKKTLIENEELKKKLKEASELPADYEEIKKELEELKGQDKVQEILVNALGSLAHTNILINSLDVLNSKKHIEMKNRILNIIEDMQNKINNI